MNNIPANDPLLKSWIEIDKNSDFPIQNLPFGIFTSKSLTPRVGIAIGDFVLDIYELNKSGFLKSLNIEDHIFQNNYLNDFIALGKIVSSNVRNSVSKLLQHDNPELKDND